MRFARKQSVIPIKMGVFIGIMSAWIFEFKRLSLDDPVVRNNMHFPVKCSSIHHNPSLCSTFFLCYVIYIFMERSYEFYKNYLFQRNKPPWQHKLLTTMLTVF